MATPSTPSGMASTAVTGPNAPAAPAGSGVAAGMLPAPDNTPKDPWCCASRKVAQPYQRCVHLLAFRQANGLDTLRTLQQYLQSLKLCLSMRSINPLYQLRGIPLPQCIECKRVDGVIHVCGHCVYAGCADGGHAAKHALEKKHSITVEVESNELYCHRCRDYVYDLDYDALVEEERLRAELRVSGAAVHHVPSQALTSKVQVSSAFIAHGVPRQGIGLRGLMNLGNTCFMNSILQSFLHNPFLQRFFLADKHNRSLCQRKGSLCLGCEMDYLFAEAYSGVRIPFTPHRFLHTMWQFSQYFAGYEQQDAHEFLISILNGLHSHCGGSATDAKCKCIVHKVFSGVMRSELTCNSCGAISTTDDIFFDISLDLPNPSGDASTAEGGDEMDVEQPITLMSCMDSFTSPEKLEFEERFRCGKCETYRECTKQLSLKSLPLVLCFHLKRFEQTSAVKRASLKIDSFVDFQEEIDIWPYTFKAIANARKTEWDGLPESQLYELFCVVVHCGKIDNGHYYCFTKHASGVWVRCEDSWITKVALRNVKEQHAYLLFYVRKELSYDG